MAFETLADLDCSVTTALGGRDKKSGKANPTELTGYFIGTRQVNSPKSKTGLSALHVFQTEKGNVGVWGKTNLDAKLQGVTPGFMTRITFTGMKETKNNPMYTYRVEVDKADSIDVTAIQSSASTEEGDADSGDQYEADEGSELPEDDVDQLPPPRATRPSTAARPATAAQQATVKDLLSRAGKR